MNRMVCTFQALAFFLIMFSTSGCGGDARELDVKELACIPELTHSLSRDLALSADGKSIITVGAGELTIYDAYEKEFREYLSATTDDELLMGASLLAKECGPRGLGFEPSIFRHACVVKRIHSGFKLRRPRGHSGSTPDTRTTTARGGRADTAG